MDTEIENTKKYQKRTTVVDFKFQLSVISSFFKIYLISTAGFYLIVTLIFGKLKMFGKEHNNSDLLSFIQEMESNVIWLFLGVFIISTAVTFYYGFHVTHKVYGPIYAIKNYLKKIINNEDVPELKLRKGDYFADLQDTVNETITHLKK